MTHTVATALILAYAGLLIAGGLIGWRVSGSRISLTASLTSAALLAIAYRISLAAAFAGYLMATLVTLGLVALFSIRLHKTRKFLPSGLLLLVSGATAILLGWATALARSAR